jgi:hypothetical protein
MDALRDTKAEIVMGHFEIAGFEMDRGNIAHEGLDRKIFDRFDTVLSGHFHHKSTDGTITYLGNQYEITWADYGDTRGFHIFDTDKRDLTFVANPYKMFHKIIYDDTEQDFAFWNAYDFSQYANTFVKIVVVNKQNAYMFDTVIDNLHKGGVADVAVVEDFTDTVIDDGDLVDQADDTLTIINRVIDTMGAIDDPSTLKSIIKELYLEALNVEQHT